MDRKGGVETPIATILLLIILAVSVLMLFILPIWSEVPKSQCIMQQFSMLRRLDDPAGTGLVQKAKQKNSEEVYHLEVMYCIDCIWFNPDPVKPQLMVKINRDPDPVPYNVSVPYLNVGQDCDSGLKKDTTYVLKVNATHVSCYG